MANIIYQQKFKRFTDRLQQSKTYNYENKGLKQNSLFRPKDSLGDTVIYLLDRNRLWCF